MGRPMAANLVRRGFPVRGFDVSRGGRGALAAAGGEPAASAAEAAAGADALVLMVVNAAQAQRRAVRRGRARRPAARRHRRADGDLPARRRRGDGGSRRGRGPPLRRRAGLGRRRRRRCGLAHHHGGGAGRDDRRRRGPCSTRSAARCSTSATRPGQGAVVKAVNQLLCGVHIAAAAEALALAGKVGVDRGVMLDIVCGSAASSWMLKDRGPRMLEAEPVVTSAVDIFVKDLGIVLEAGRDAKAALPLAALAHQLFLSTSGRGTARPTTARSFAPTA